MSPVRDILVAVRQRGRVGRPIRRRRARPSCKPGMSRPQPTRPRAAAPDRWLSIVTTTTRIGVGSAAEMSFGIVQRLHRDGRRARSLAKRSVLRRALPRTKNGILPSSRSAPGAQDQRHPAASRRYAGSAAAAGAALRRPDGMARRRRGTRNRRGTSSAGAPPGPSSADAPRCRTARSRPRSPSAASSAPGNPARARARKSPRRECPAAWRCGAPSACPAPARAAGGRDGCASTSR